MKLNSNQNFWMQQILSSLHFAAPETRHVDTDFGLEQKI